MTQPADPVVMPVDVVSDVVCPWCFIGKRRLEQALTLVPDIPLTVRWRPYFLNPWVPREGISRSDYLTTKFGSVEAYERGAHRIAAAAAAEGLAYRLDAISRQPNTLDCHRLIRWAGERDGADADISDAGSRHHGVNSRAARMKQRLMELYFSEGADLTQRDIVVSAGLAIGLDGQELEVGLAGGRDEQAVTDEAMAASRAGVDGVPCFIFGGVLAVAGAQSADYLAGAIRRAFAQFCERLASGQITDPTARPY